MSCWILTKSGQNVGAVAATPFDVEHKVLEKQSLHL